MNDVSVDFTFSTLREVSCTLTEQFPLGLGKVKDCLCTCGQHLILYSHNERGQSKQRKSVYINKRVVVTLGN